MNFRSASRKGKELLHDIKTVLKLPLTFSLLFVDFCLVVLFVGLIGAYNAYAVLGLFISQTAIIYFLLKEIWRQWHMLPRSEAFETNLEKWNAAFKRYEELVEKH